MTQALSSSKGSAVSQNTQKSVWSYAVSTVNEISDLNIRQHRLLCKLLGIGTSPLVLIVGGYR